MLIQAEPLTRLVAAILEHAGVEPERALVCAQHLVGANLKGHDSHGVGMAPSYVAWIRAGGLKPNQRGEIVQDSGAVLVVDGGFGLGAAVAKETMELAIERAKRFGVACVALRDSCHIGRIGTYGEQCAEAGLVSTHYVNVVGGAPTVTPFGGRDPRMLTNPYCCTIPRAGGEHLVLDFATSAVAMGKLRVAHMKGEPAPEGVLIDAGGRPTTDTTTFYNREPTSFLLPFGLHKGGGLQVMCELLGGALAGHRTMRPAPERAVRAAINSMLSIVIDPDALGGRAAYEAEAEAMIAYIREARPAAGVDRVRLPGDPERETLAARIAAGIPIDDNSWADILRAGESVGVDQAAAAAIIG